MTRVRPSLGRLKPRGSAIGAGTSAASTGVSAPTDDRLNQAGADLETMGRTVSQVRTELAKSEGRRETLQRRLDQLTQEVGKAKGRELLKGDVDAFLQDLQASLHKKSVGSYERLLTALAHDVLKSGDEIGLDLYTERGLPALDIFVRAGDHREDILNGCGGSMTNVISLGLRMIATVRSGMRKFVALDEPDCWIAPSRVPNFYGVIDDLGQKLDVQSLLISHHALELMPEGFAISRLYKDGNRIICQNDPKSDAWAEDQVGIRRLRMVSFMSHEDTEVRLAPGTTAIIGDNHIGKSCVIRALRAVTYGEISDADIRHGCKNVAVEIEIEGGRVVKLTRQPGRNPVNEWTLEDLEGNVLTDADTNTEFRSGGRSAPDWVGKVTGIQKFEGLEHQLSHQKFPVFLMGEKASTRASVLSIGRESGYAQKMIERQRQKSRADADLIKRGEIEVNEIQEQLLKLHAYQELAKDLDAVEEGLTSLRGRHDQTIAAHGLMAQCSELEARLARAEPVAAALGALPTEFPSIEANVEKRREITRIGSQIAGIEKRLGEAVRISEAMPDELPTVPELADLGEIRGILRTLQGVTISNSEATKRAARLSGELEEVDRKIAAAIEDAGHVCPLCNNNIEHSHDIL